MKRSDITNTIGNMYGEVGHKKVIEVYNSQDPLPRGYKLKDTDPRCAATVSAVFIMNGYPDFAECSCEQMVKKAQDLGIWVEDDSYVPSPGDVVMYDWQDSGIGDDVGVPDHTGIVMNVTKSKIVVREGNKKKSIGNRDILVDGINIRGYITPKYDEEALSEVKEELRKEESASAPVQSEKAKEKQEKAQEEYVVGRIYTITASGLNVRVAPGVSNKKVSYNNLTSDGRKHAIGSALIRGTRVTCLSIKNVGNEVWMKIPSGWICARSNNNIYVA